MRPGITGSPSSPQCQRLLKAHRAQPPVPAETSLPPARPRGEMVLRGPRLTSDLPPHLSPPRPCRAPLSSARRPGTSSRSLHPRPASAAAFYAGAQSQQVGDSHSHVGPRRAPTRAPRLGATESRSRPLGGQTHQSNRSGVGRTPGPAPPTGNRGAGSRLADSGGTPRFSSAWLSPRGASQPAVYAAEPFLGTP